MDSYIEIRIGGSHLHRFGIPGTGNHHRTAVDRTQSGEFLKGDIGAMAHADIICVENGNTTFGIKTEGFKNRHRA